MHDTSVSGLETVAGATGKGIKDFPTVVVNTDACIRIKD